MPQRAGQNAQPTNNILAVTPESAGSIAMIGRAQDLGMCRVVKRDGKICGSWTDKRIGEVCEWHTTNAVQRQRAGRAEFFAGSVPLRDGRAVADPTLIDIYRTGRRARRNVKRLTILVVNGG